MKISLAFKDNGKVRTAVVVRGLLCVEAPGQGFPGLPGGCGFRGGRCRLSCPVAHVHLSTRKSTPFNRLSEGLWPRTGCVIMLLHHSERAYREESAPGRVRPAEGAPGEKAGQRCVAHGAVVGAGNLGIILEVSSSGLMTMSVIMIKSIYIHGHT